MSVVLLHPLGLDQECWHQLKIQDAVVLDFPGHGRCPLSSVHLTMEGLADYVADRIPDLSDVVGLSLGGVVGQHLAVRHPRRVHSVMIACAGPAADPQTMLDRARAVELDGMEGVLATTLERWFTPVALREPEHRGVAYARRRLLANDPRVFAQYWRALARHDISDQLSQIRAPVTVVAAEHDASVPVPILRGMANALPLSRLEILRGPHLLQLEEPEQFSAALSRHLEWSMVA